MSDKDPHRTLGVGPDATPEEIRTAFRSAVRRAHPDTGASSGDDGGVREVIDAYRRLMDAAGRTDGSHTTAAEDARRVAVRRGPSRRSSTPRTSNGPCAACGGSGVVRTLATCPACRGRAEITELGDRTARVLRCRSCGGVGEIGRLHPCAACGGSGSPPAQNDLR